MRRALLLALTLFAIRLHADCNSTKPPSQYSVSFKGPACTSTVPCVQNKSIHFSVVPANGCYIPFYPGPCPAPYTIDACDTLTWNFGDGTAPKTVGGTGAVDHVFTKAGNFSVEVEVRNAYGSGMIHGSAYICADPPTYLRFSKKTYNVSETAGTVTVTLERTGDTARPFSVNYVSVLNTPNGQFVRNFESINGPITFAAGETTKNITHKIQDDNVFKGDYDQSVGVVSDGAVVMDAGPVTTAIVRLMEDEAGPELTIDDVTVPEGNGLHAIDIPVHLTGPAGDYVYAWCVPKPGTARAEIDFLERGSTAAFEPGQTTSKCQVQIVGNTIPESDKTFSIVVDPVIGPVKIKRGTAFGLLTNDDVIPQPPPPPPPPPPPTKQSLSFATKTVKLEAGKVDSVNLHATIAATVTLTTSDASVIEVGSSVSAPGPVRIVALKPGTATITAKAGDATATLDVEVPATPRRRATR